MDGNDGINTANTGEPMNVFYSPNGQRRDRARQRRISRHGDSAPEVSCTGSTSQSTAQTLLNYFPGCTFTIPGPNNPFGNLGRNAFRAPNFENWDLGVSKFVTIREGMRLQFRSEFFNVLNHTNFWFPNQQENSSSFGQTSTAFPARQIQFALKLLF